MSTEVLGAGSNVLGDLAVRINTEHEAACAAVKSSAVHAMAAGDLLIEAKDTLKLHGAWLLKQNCEMSERTAQLYMRMARNRAAIEANTQHVANLSLRGAMAVIAPPKPDNDIEEWAAQQLEEPFTDWDMNDHSWLQTKLAHCVGLPVNIQWACVPPRRSRKRWCLISPYAKQQGKYKSDVSDSIHGSISILIAAQLIVVALFGEIEAREKFSEGRLAKRVTKVIEALVLAVDTKKAWWAELSASPISNEAKFEAALAPLRLRSPAMPVDPSKLN